MLFTVVTFRLLGMNLCLIGPETMEPACLMPIVGSIGGGAVMVMWEMFCRYTLRHEHPFMAKSYSSYCIMAYNFEYDNVP